MTPSIVTFKWRPPPGYSLRFGASDVNLLYERFKQHYPGMQRFICITDDATGLAPGIERVALGRLFADLRNPSWRRGPNCHRKLIAFAPGFAKIAGQRFAVVDIDIKPLADMTSIFERPEDFVGWRSGRETGRPQPQFGGALLMMNAGARAKVWEWFSKDPSVAIATAHAAGYHGSDQAIVSYCLDRDAEAYWTEADGVYYYRKLVPKAHIIKEMRIASRQRVAVPPSMLARMTPRHRKLNYDTPNLVPRPANAKLMIFSHGMHEGSAATRVMSPWLYE